MHPADLPRYRIDGFRSQDTVSDGSDFDTTADTLKEAKARARYTVSEDFRQSAEMSTVLGYARVIDTRSGDCVYDCFAKEDAKTDAPKSRPGPYTSFMVRHKTERMVPEYLLRSGKVGAPTKADPIAEFDSLDEAQAEVCWHMQRSTPGFPTGEYEYLPHSNL